MNLVTIESGTRLTIEHNGRRVEAVVNGPPYLIAVAGMEPTELSARIPCYVHDGDLCLNVAAANVYCVGSAALPALGSALVKP